MFFCSVLDGHGPSGHDVARLVRDILPSRLSSAFKMSLPTSDKWSSDIDCGNRKDDSRDRQENKNSEYLLFPMWEASLISSFKEMDEEIDSNSTFDHFCSGTTAVTVIKQVTINPLGVALKNRCQCMVEEIIFLLVYNFMMI